MQNLLIHSLILITALFANCANADDEETIPDWNKTTLTGDWHGLRSELYKNGVDLEFTHKSDVLANVSGGIQKGTAWMGYTDAQATIDLEKLLGWAATTAYVDYHSGLGGKFNTHYVGGFVGEDNIEVATNTAQFYQAWVQKNWLDNRLSVLGGLYAIDTEFYITEASGLFIQAPYGMANEFAQAGKNGPPIYPLGALALRLKYITPSRLFYVQGAITDGFPGDTDNPRGTHIKLGHGDGSLSLVEFGYHPESDDGSDLKVGLHKLAIGLWGYSDKFDDLESVDVFGNPIQRHNRGAYVSAEGAIYKEVGTTNQGLSSFLRLGKASKNINQADWSGSIGVRYLGLIKGRDDDEIGFAITVNHASDKYRRLSDALSSETDFELTYRAQLKPWLAIQPTFQYINNPGMDKVIEDAKVIGFRTEIAL